MRGDDDHRPRDEISLGGRPGGDGPTLLNRLGRGPSPAIGGVLRPGRDGCGRRARPGRGHRRLPVGVGGPNPRPPRAPSSTPPPNTGDAVSSPPLPVGRPPTMPYHAGGALVWPHGSLTIDREHIASMVSRDGASLVRMWDQQEVLLVDGPELTPLAGRVFNGPAVGPGGELAAWIAVEQAATGSTLVLVPHPHPRGAVARDHQRDVLAVDGQAAVRPDQRPAGIVRAARQADGPTRQRRRAERHRRCLAAGSTTVLAADADLGPPTPTGRRRWPRTRTSTTTAPVTTGPKDAPNRRRRASTQPVEEGWAVAARSSAQADLVARTVVIVTPHGHLPPAHPSPAEGVDHGGARSASPV